MMIWQRPSLRHQPVVWGLWTTLAFGAAIAVVFMLTQLGIVFAYAFYEATRGSQVSLHAVAVRFSADGLYFALVTSASAGVCSVLTWWAARLRKGISPMDYLGLRRVKVRVLLAWMTVTAVLMFVSDLAEPLLKHPRGSEFTLAIYRSATFVPLLWFAIVIAAPVFEELFFRGFLLQGLRYSKLGPAVAVVLTALGWAISHSQYSDAEITEIFIFGLVLGTARLRTESVFMPIAMHAFVNLVTLFQAALIIGGH